MTLPLFLEGHIVPVPLHSPPGVPTPWLIMMGMVVPASGYQPDFLGGKTPPPEAITTTADPDFFPALPSEFVFGGQWDLITELPQDWGNRLLEGTNKTLCAPGPRTKEQ